VKDDGNATLVVHNFPRGCLIMNAKGIQSVADNAWDGLHHGWNDNWRTTHNICSLIGCLSTTFLAASTECSAGSNDHFVVVGGGPSLVQFDGRPLK
jgi:hypothetical protein